MSLSSTFPDVKKQDTVRDVADLRASFRTGATKEIALRRTLLLQLQQLLNEGDALLKAAMWKDLHKNPIETHACEIAMIHSELVDHLDHLNQWSAPERVSTNLLNLPGLSYIHREPLGVACIIGTWNYPLNLLFVPMISAIAAGNCVLLRLPGDDTTRHLNNVLITLLDKYMDKQYIRYVYGGVEETKRILEQRFDIIFATGGGFLGKIVAQAAAIHLTPVVLELGGKSPCIIDETADIALVGRRVAWGAFTNAGQTCVRPDYLLVDERVGDAVVQALEASIKSFYGEDAQSSDSYGRVVNQRMFDRLSKVLEADAAHITFGGKRDGKDLFISPTLLNFKTDLNGFINSGAMKEELFGPILPIYYYKANDFSFPIQFINDREKPLSLMIFSTDKTNQKQIIMQTSSGGVVLNDTMVQLSSGYLPFGGVGNSGYGTYHGRFGFNTFSHQKSVLYKYSLLDLAQRYAPYTAANERILRLLLYPISRKHIQSVKILAFLTILSIIGYLSVKK